MSKIIYSENKRGIKGKSKSVIVEQGEDKERVVTTKIVLEPPWSTKKVMKVTTSDPSPSLPLRFLPLSHDSRPVLVPTSQCFLIEVVAL